MMQNHEDPFLDPCHDLVGGRPAILGPWQLALLQQLGLENDASLLDLGCGTLRGGLHLIGFLDPRRYYGADPHACFLDLAAGLTSRAGLESKQPRLLSLEELDRRELQFDWILTQSVLNHLDEQDTVATVDRVARLLAPRGRWVSTVRFDTAVERVHAGKPHGRRPREYWRALTNPAWFRDVLEDRHLIFEVIRDARHPGGMDVFAARSGDSTLRGENMA